MAGVVASDGVLFVSEAIVMNNLKAMWTVIIVLFGSMLTCYELYEAGVTGKNGWMVMAIITLITVYIAVLLIWRTRR